MATRKPLLRRSVSDDVLEQIEDQADTVADMLEQFLYSTGVLHLDRLDDGVRSLSKLVAPGTGKELLANYREAFSALYALQKKCEEIKAEVFHRQR